MKPVEHCQQGFCGCGEQIARNINVRRPSDLVKQYDVVLSVQSSPPESNTVQEIGFVDCRIYPTPAGRKSAKKYFHMFVVMSDLRFELKPNI